MRLNKMQNDEQSVCEKRDEVDAAQRRAVLRVLRLGIPNQPPNSELMRNIQSPRRKSSQKSRNFRHPRIPEGNIPIRSQLKDIKSTAR